MHHQHIAQLIATALQCSPNSSLPLETPLIATLKSETNPEYWVSVYGNILDFSYFPQQQPHAYTHHIFSSLLSWQLIDWSPGRLATVEFGIVELQKLSKVINLLFDAMHETEEYSLICIAESFGQA